jgi:hypothetical protein
VPIELWREIESEPETAYRLKSPAMNGCLMEALARDPVARSIASAPLDDEPLTEEDQALERAEAWLERNGGKGIPHALILAEFGLSPKDFPLK